MSTTLMASTVGHPDRSWPRQIPLALACLAIPALAVLPETQLSVAATGGLFVLAGTLIRPDLALVLLLAMVPFSSLFKISLGELDLASTDLLFILFLVSWGLQATRTHQIALPRGRYIAPVATLLLIVLTSALVTTRFPLTAKEAVKWLQILVISSYVATHFREPAFMRLLLGALFVAAGLEALFGIFQFVTGTGPPFFAIGPFMRAHGHFGQPNPYGGYLASVFPIALVSALAGPDRRFRMVAIGCALCAGTAILMSLSRGAWLGLSVGLIVMLLHWRRSALRAVAGLAPAGVVLAVLAATDLLPPVLADRIAPMVEYFGVFDVRGVKPTPENFALIERLAHWQAGWDMFMDHPLLGVGAGNYPARYSDYMLPGWPESLGHAHNYYLNMAAEAGIGAFAALLWVLGTFICLSRGAFRRLQGYDRYLALGLLGSTLVFAVHSFFDNLLVNSMAIQIGAFLGLAIILHDRAVSSASIERTRVWTGVRPTTLSDSSRGE